MFPQPNPETIREVEAANEAFYRSFERLDLKAMESVWLHSNRALCVHPGWDLIRGWSAIRQSWELIFASTKYMEFDIEGLSLDVSPPWAQVVCYENLLTATSGPAERARVLATNVYLQDPGGTWRLLHHHASQIMISPPELTVPRG